MPTRLHAEHAFVDVSQAAILAVPKRNEVSCPEKEGLVVTQRSSHAEVHDSQSNERREAEGEVAGLG